MNTYCKHILMPGLILWLGISFAAAQVSDPEFDKTIRSLLGFTVKTMSVSELQNQLKISESPMMLLDAREYREYEVSHLPNAIYVGYNNFSMEKLKKVPKDSRLIVYCSIGYRSEKIAEKLISAGFKNVYNLYGGIFEWANAGNRVVNNFWMQTSKVHAYDQTWGKWLKKADKVY
jgi:rhodanese-related sulfurtransferase